MLHKCANPACSNLFRRLSEGKLFQVESEYLEPSLYSNGRGSKAARRIEHFWLCDPCSSFLTLVFDKTCGILTVPLPEPRGRRALTPVQFKRYGQSHKPVLSEAS